ncbi:alpha/beta fold hydrolase [Marinimicrobium alkaliphilum]|uniref:alpha/beta fold hydrolase n=1 Tax=Marinimicrobium alkaliphilum TaxID=2202654 RepID=UPI00130040B6|nr:alpha/beta hydrolase [Marinimicrobium alkaliphilum]
MDLRPCHFSLSSAISPDSVVCADLVAPGHERTFRLPVVILRARAGRASDDALIYLQGGPGAAAGLHRDGIDEWFDWLTYVEAGRDLILIDPRGVGEGEPALWCDAYERFSQEILARPVSLETELAEGALVLDDCFQRLGERGDFDPADYGTPQSAQDLAALMTLLESYQGFHLLGVSYGTRVAMVAAAENDRVLSLVLDSPFPDGRGGAEQWPETLANALEQHFSWCDETDCYRGEGDYRNDFFQALGSLRHTPWQIRVERWGRTGSQSVAVNDDRFLAGVFNALYEDSAWPRVPAAVAAVHAGEREPVRELMTALVNLAFSEDWFSLVYYAVDCQDNPGIDRGRYLSAAADYPDLLPYLAPLAEYWGCPWSGPSREHALTVPVPTVPGLILAGERDPITPQAWAEQLHLAWPGSRLELFEGRGHGVIWSDTRALKLAKELWQSAGDTP